MKKLKADDLMRRQVGCATHLIDKYALRVGGEKATGKDGEEAEEADTVGCCSLRVEHITFPDENVVELDFLGKDSIRFNHNDHIAPENDQWG